MERDKEVEEGARGCWQSQTQQPTIDERGKGEWWVRSRRLTGGNATANRGRQEREAAARRKGGGGVARMEQEAKATTASEVVDDTHRQ